MSQRVKIIAAAALLLFAVSQALPTSAESKKKPKTWLVKVTDDGGGAFLPATLSIRRGQFVHWRAWDTWSDQPGFTNAHNVILIEAPPGVRKKNLSSNPIGTTSLNFKRKIRVKGEYKFICSLHPETMITDVSVRG